MIFMSGGSEKRCHEHAGNPALSSLQRRRFVVTKMVVAESLRPVSRFDVFRNDQK